MIKLLKSKIGQTTSSPQAVKTSHQWVNFEKGRVKIKACACCGEMNLPSNMNGQCSQQSLLNSPIIKAGYRKSAATSQVA